MKSKSKVSGLESKVQSPKSKVQNLGAEGRQSRFRVRSSSLKVQAQPIAAEDYLSRFLCAGFALALLATGCASPRPLKGGRAVTTHKPAGIIEQTLVQGENPSQASKQTQETVKVRTYTVPAGSRMEQPLIAECGVRNAESRRADAANASAAGPSNYQL